ncbi:MAG: hypothetical protein KDB80_17235, partial [Planctomycetes bacterium]|nr:hypothetical protein [Planctomycetota bacterium]
MAVLTSGERARVTMIFCLMGGAILALLVRLAWLQLGQHTTSNDLSIKYRSRSEELPAERSRIVDRHGELLAYDRPVYQAWGEIYLPVDPETGALDESRRPVDRLVSDLMIALRNDRTLVPDLQADRELRARLDLRIRKKLASRCKALAERILAAHLAKKSFAPKRVK